MTERFTQKYCLVQLITPLSDGFEFVMSEWPLHVTLADIFKITGGPQSVLDRLGAAVAELDAFSSTIVDEDWFGPERTVRVRLLDPTPALRELHEVCVTTLEEFDVVFNSPQFMHEGFRPHSTIKRDQELRIGESVRFGALTLIDMFPDGDPTKRRIVGTVPFGE